MNDNQIPHNCDAGLEARIKKIISDGPVLLEIPKEILESWGGHC
jgi:hypothetical protein